MEQRTGKRSVVAGLAHRLEEDLEVVLVDLDDAGIERAVTRARVAPLLGVEERQTKLAAKCISN